MLVKLLNKFEQKFSDYEFKQNIIGIILGSALQYTYIQGFEKVLSKLYDF